MFAFSFSDFGLIGSFQKCLPIGQIIRQNSRVIILDCSMLSKKETDGFNRSVTGVQLIVHLISLIGKIYQRTAQNVLHAQRSLVIIRRAGPRLGTWAFCVFGEHFHNCGKLR